MILAVLQARTGSTRLPGKVLRPILGHPMLAWQLERVSRARSLDGIVLATSRAREDDALADLARDLGVDVHRGDLEDVLARVYEAARARDAKHVVRLTGDCPLVDPALIDRVVAAHLAAGADYTSNTLERSFPDGLDVEVMSLAALEVAWREARLPSEREHVTPFLYGHPERFTLESITHDEDLSALRWTVDHARDLELVRAVFERLVPASPAFGMQDVLALARAQPELFARNADIPTNEGLAASRARDAAAAEGASGS